MIGQYLTIDAKHRRPLGFQASLADFSVTPGEAVDAGIVRHSPNISLYCLDDAAKQALFVELPPDVDLATAAFVYQTQYEQAQRLIAVPYASFLRLARELPPVQHLVMIYMTGRSGSTLLSRLFNELPNVLSLSEPDAANQFVHLWNADPTRDAELQELLDCTVRCLFKPTAAKAPTTYVLKLKGEGTQLMDRVQATFPRARNLFLYRDAIGWVTSFLRLFRQWQFPEVLPLSERVMGFRQRLGSDLLPLTAYLDEGTTELSTPQYLTLWWLALVEWYLTQHERGIPALAVRYDDLNTHRERVVAEIFTYCGLATAQVRQALGVFERDSQAGTGLARESPREGNRLRMSDDQRNDVLRILRRHPVIKQPDFTVPGTLRV